MSGASNRKTSFLDYDDESGYDSFGDEYDKDNVSFSAKSKTSQNAKVSSKSTSSSSIKPPRAKAQFVPSAKRYHSKDKSFKRPPIWISLAGHIDAGKSTLMAQLLQEGIGTLDVTPEEQSHGITMDLMVKRIQADPDLIFIDAPGHADLIEITSKAASMAMIVLFVIDPTPNEFERGLKAQIKEHLRAICALSNPKLHLIFVINKMDKINWDASRLTYVTNSITSLIQQIYFERPSSTTHFSFKNTICPNLPVTEDISSTDLPDIKFIPVSAMTGENLFLSSPKSSCSSLWDTIQDIVSSIFALDTGLLDESFLISILHTSTASTNSNSCLLEGCLVQGIVPFVSSINVKLLPGNHSAKISKISLGEGSKNVLIKHVAVGEFISFSLDGIDPSLISASSSIIFPTVSPLSITESKVLPCLFYIYSDTNTLVIPGSKFLAIVCSVSGTRSNPCEVISLDLLPLSYDHSSKKNQSLSSETLLLSTGPMKAPRFLKSGQKGHVTLLLQFPVLFHAKFPIKILLMHNGQSIGAGIACSK